MTIRKFLSILFKRFWLILLLPLIAAGAAYALTQQVQPTYSAATTLLVGTLPNTADPGSSSNQVQTAGQLAQAHALLVKQPAVLMPTANTLQFPGGWQALFSEVSAQSAGQVLQIRVLDHDAGRAQLVADELARQLILISPLNTLNSQDEKQKAFIANQQTGIQSEIEKSQQKLDKLNSDAEIESDPAKSQDLNLQIGTLQAKIDNLRRDYAALSALVANRPQSFITVLAPAAKPEVPESPNAFLIILIAATLGLMAAIGLAFLWDYFDNSVKNAADVERVLNLRTVGAIAKISGIRRPQDSLITMTHPLSPVSEAYHVLGTNLRLSGIENPGGAIIVTSPGPKDGKSTTAANLAIALAQSGRHVILVDADFRHPSVHNLFGLANGPGLSDLFADNPLTLESVLQPTPIKGLSILTSGKTPTNPTAILDSKRMNKIVTQMRCDSDMVVFDSPAVLSAADAVILGTQCSGALLVVNVGKTPNESVTRAAENLKQANINLAGVVLNRSPNTLAVG